jgi:choline-sulfatase
MTTERPNLILILTDHFRRDAVGTSTPQLVQLAARGTRFDNAYCASPLCQPSRSAVISGLYPSQNGVSGNQSEPLRTELRHDTFMNRLRAAGYYTALVGKHHFLDRYGLGVDVTEDDETIRDYGFDQVFQVVDDGENGHNDDEYTRFLRQQGRLEEFREALAGPRSDPFRHPFDEDDSADGFIGLGGVRFIEDYRGDQPFYLNLSFVGPHPPLWHPGELRHVPESMTPPLGAPDSAETRLKRAHYMDKCALIDRYLGRLLEALQARNLVENTVLIFTSDHGDCLGDFGIWDKRHFFEASVGVPLVMAGPGVPKGERLNGPRVSKALVSHLDLYPTLLELAGAAAERERHRAGLSILAMLRDQPGAGHEAVFAELATSVMIRTGSWKLVFDPEQGGVRQLFNLAVDPLEQGNLAGVAGYESVTLDLVQRLLAHRIRLTQTTHVKEEQRLQSVRSI